MVRSVVSSKQSYSTSLERVSDGLNDRNRVVSDELEFVNGVESVREFIRSCGGGDYYASYGSSEDDSSKGKSITLLDVNKVEQYLIEFLEEFNSKNADERSVWCGVCTFSCYQISIDVARVWVKKLAFLKLPKRDFEKETYRIVCIGNFLNGVNGVVSDDIISILIRYIRSVDISVFQRKMDKKYCFGEWFANVLMGGLRCYDHQCISSILKAIVDVLLKTRMSEDYLFSKSTQDNIRSVISYLLDEQNNLDVDRENIVKRLQCCLPA